MVSFIKDNDFVNEFLFAAPTPSTYTERSFPGDLFWLVAYIHLLWNIVRGVNSILQEDEEREKFPNLFLCKEGACCCLVYLHGAIS